MTAKIIDGRAVAEKILAETRSEIKTLESTPGLGVILVGDDPASKIYVRKKKETAEKIGVHFESFLFPKDASEDQVVRTVIELNEREDIQAL